MQTQQTFLNKFKQSKENLQLPLPNLFYINSKHENQMEKFYFSM